MKKSFVHLQVCTVFFVSIMVLLNAKCAAVLPSIMSAEEQQTAKGLSDEGCDECIVHSNTDCGYDHLKPNGCAPIENHNPHNIPALLPTTTPGTHCYNFAVWRIKHRHKQDYCYQTYANPGDQCNTNELNGCTVFQKKVCLTAIVWHYVNGVRAFPPVSSSCSGPTGRMLTTQQTGTYFEDDGSSDECDYFDPF